MESFARSDVGLVRKRNEDSVFVDNDLRLGALADGMGGLPAGDLASRLAIEDAVDVLARTAFPRDENLLIRGAYDAAHRANRRLRELGAAYKRYAGSGTTLVYFALASHERVVIGNVGDSRAYRWDGDALHQLSRDHSVVQEAIDAGEVDEKDRRGHPQQHIITRYIGDPRFVEADVDLVTLGANDVLMLCSDGLTDLVDDADIAAVFRDGGPMPEIADALVDLAKCAGGHDNVSVVLARP